MREVKYEATIIRKSYTLTPYTVNLVEQKARQMRETNASAALRSIILEWEQFKLKEQEHATG